MKVKLFILSIAHIVFCQQIYSQGKIILEGELRPGFNGHSLELISAPLYAVGKAEQNSNKQEVSNGKIKWILQSEEPLYIYSPQFFGKGEWRYFIEPGDSICLSYKGDSLSFSGRGAAKFKLLYGINKIKDEVKKPANTAFYITYSIKDYLEWNAYLNKQLQKIIPLIDSYKERLPIAAYTTIKSGAIADVEYARTMKFTELVFNFWGNRNNVKINGLTAEDLIAICDSTLNGPEVKWISSLSNYSNNVLYYYMSNRINAYRKYEFNHDSLSTELKRTQIYYSMAKQKYKGWVREQLLARLVYNNIIKELGFLPETEIILADYYNQPGFPEFKQWVSNYEKEARKLRRGSSAPDFTLWDRNGKSITKEDIKGKIALINFWVTDCVECSDVVSALSKVNEALNGDTNVIFLNVSTDKEKEKWIESIDRGNFSAEKEINVYTGGSGTNHPMLKTYSVSSFPKLYLVGPSGKVLMEPLTRLGDNGCKQLIELIRHQLAVLHDGPYVLHDKGFLLSHSILPSGTKVERLNKDTSLVLQAQTDQLSRKFSITLKDSLSVEPSEFDSPEKLYALSDIEGNFDAFRRLLQAGGIIDEDFNWTFGNGHLVLNGDFFDRGQQVTEVLWLIYTLEEKAKAAGGYVHFILGNHEIMNLSGNLRYVTEKYKANTQQLGLTYQMLYGPSSELGRWLRTKNIIEKIGDLLFVHGGVSKEISDWPLTITDINSLARQYYDKDTLATQSSNPIVRMIFDSQTSPFWFRSYFLDADKKRRIMRGGGIKTFYKPTMRQLNEVLDKYNVDKMITGHTQVAVEGLGMGGALTAHYNNKIINLDTHHASGKSEALLIQNGKYYRVNTEGERELLFNSPSTAFQLNRAR